MAESVSLEDKLKTLCLKDVSQYSLAGQKYIGKVVDVYDGDTCKIIICQDGKFVRYTCRLIGIDTPEMKSKTDGAYKARNRLIQLATNVSIELDNRGTHPATTRLVQSNSKLVHISCYEFDKYGRLLVKLYEYDDHDCVKDYNSILVDEKLANSYDGGHKEGFDVNS